MTVDDTNVASASIGAKSVLFEPAESFRNLIGQLLWFGFWLGVTAIGIWLKPNPAGHGTHTQLGLGPCPSAAIMNRPCPGCGLTTSWTALLHGDLSASLAAHPLGAALYLIFTLSALLAIGGVWRNHRLVADSPAMNRFLIALFVVVFGFGMARFAMVQNYSPYDNAIWQVSSEKSKR